MIDTQAIAEAIAALITFLFSLIAYPQTSTYQATVVESSGEVVVMDEPVTVVVEEPSQETGPWVCVNEETGFSMIFGGNGLPNVRDGVTCYLEDPSE